MKKKTSSASEEAKVSLVDNRYILEPIQTVEGEQRIKKYAKIKVVGQGSYSKCFLVKNSQSDSTYVVKIIPKRKLQVLEKEKLIYEIKIHQSLSHPNVVHLDHWFEDEQYQYIFMEYCSKGNIQVRLSDGGTLPEKTIQQFGRQIVQAIGYCHSQKILHRDLKLSNFYLDDDENVKLGDFGFACQLASDYDRKRESCGTPNYIAPQAISGFGYSFSSDVWGIGVALFRMKFGICPFQGPTVKETLQKVKLCQYVFPKSIKISKQLKDLIEKIFNINYDDRLTTDQILMHPFFANDCQDKEPKRGFSLSRLFRGETKQASVQKQPQRQGMMNRQSRNNSSSKKTEQQPKRYNSCETLKEMKEIFKSKSKPTLVTTQNHTQMSSPYYNLSITMKTNSSGPNNALDTMTSKTNRYSIYEYGLEGEQASNMGDSRISKQPSSSRAGRLNEFIKNQVTNLESKTNSKIAGNGKNQNRGLKTMLNYGPTLVMKQPQQSKQLIGEQDHHPVTSKYSSTSEIQNNSLFQASKKYFLPMSVQQEKDLLIVHYQSTLKQIISPALGKSFLMYRGRNIYTMQGEEVKIDKFGKVFRHILENKINIQEKEDLEDEAEWEGGKPISKVLHLLPQKYICAKEGVILRYADRLAETIVAKLFIQEGFYIWQIPKNKSITAPPAFMYHMTGSKTFQILQGVVVMKIYTGWVKNLLKA